MCDTELCQRLTGDVPQSTVTFNSLTLLDSALRPADDTSLQTQSHDTNDDIEINVVDVGKFAS